MEAVADARGHRGTLRFSSDERSRFFTWKGRASQQCLLSGRCHFLPSPRGRQRSARQATGAVSLSSSKRFPPPTPGTGDWLRLLGSGSQLLSPPTWGPLAPDWKGRVFFPGFCPTRCGHCVSGVYSSGSRRLLEEIPLVNCLWIEGDALKTQHGDEKGKQEAGKSSPQNFFF